MDYVLKSRGWGWCIVAEFVKTLKKRNRLSDIVIMYGWGYFWSVRGVGGRWGLKELAALGFGVWLLHIGR